MGSLRFIEKNACFGLRNFILIQKSRFTAKQALEHPFFGKAWWRKKFKGSSWLKYWLFLKFAFVKQ